jgi:DNA-binding transcriptional regulator GbsR (MarR family)
MSTDPAIARQKALELVAETMAELIAFWGFKASTGRIWALLYLSPDPLPADAIAERLSLSSGAVSMGLAELAQWGIVDRAPSSERKRLFRAETDVWGMVKRVVRERELRLVGRAVDRFAEASELLRASLVENPHDRQAAFMLERLAGLSSLATTGYRLVEMFATSGLFTLDPIRGALQAVRSNVRP